MSDGPPSWAFLSYSHADQAIARRLHAAIEAWEVPVRLRGRETAGGPAPRRFRPVFRDRDELAADPDLKATVAANLAGSAWLIVVCSPAAAESPWVAEEIRLFKAVHGEGRILAVIVAGEPFASRHPGCEAEECFPAPLRTRLAADGTESDVAAEPVAADLRPGGDGRRLVILKLMAGMLGVGLDELIHRAAQRRNRQMAAVSIGSLVLVLVLGTLAGTAILSRNEARRERAAADARRAQAEGLVDFMLGDLRDRLDAAGRLDLLDAVDARAMAFYSAAAPTGLSPDELGHRARALHLLGDIRDRRGDQAGALAAFRQALATTGALLAANPDDPRRLYDHSQSAYWVGWIAFERGDMVDAIAWFSRYKALTDRLVAAEPGKDSWRAEAAWAQSNLEAARLMDGPAPGAARAFSRSLAISGNLARRAPGDAAKQMDLANSRLWLAQAEAAEGDLPAAEADLAAERGVYQRLLARQPGDKQALAALAANRLALAELQGRASPAAALGELTAAADEIDSLINSEPESAAYRVQAATTYAALSRALLGTGRAQAAAQAAGRAVDLAEALARADPGEGRWQGSLLGSARASAMEAALALATTPEARRAALAGAPQEARRLTALAQTMPNNVTLARVHGRDDPARRRPPAAGRAALISLAKPGPPPLPRLRRIPPSSGGNMTGRGLAAEAAAKARLAAG